MTERNRYRRSFDRVGSGHPTDVLPRVLEAGTRVLDVGCGDGDLGRVLIARGLVVDGIEPDPDRADAANQKLARVYVGAAPDIIPEEKYAAMLFSDVLEHVADPKNLLAWATLVLQDSGSVFVFIPNSANYHVRLKIARGDWSYSDRGYFDRDHLRFYDTSTLSEIAAGTSFAEVRRWHYSALPLRVPFRDGLTAWRPNLFAGACLIQFVRSSR